MKIPNKKVRNKIVMAIGLMAIIGLFLYECPSMNTPSAVVVLYFTGHMSYNDAIVALTALGIPSAAATAILTSSAVANAIGTGILNAVIERILIAFLGFWGWILLAGLITAIV